MINAIPQLAARNPQVRALLDFFASSSVRARFVRGVFWSLTGAVASQGLGLLASVISARLLGPAGYGQLGILLTTVSTFGVFAGLGLGLTATKYVAELRSSDPARAGRIVALITVGALLSGSIIALTVLFFAPSLAARSLNAPDLLPELRIACGILFLNALTGTQTGALAGFEAFRTIARINIWRGVLSFPITVFGVLLWGLRGAIWAALAIAAINWLLNHIALGRECTRNGIHVDLREAVRERTILWKFSLPALLSNSLVTPVTWIANTIVVAQADGYTQMGLYSAADQWRTAITFLPTILCQPALTLLASAYGEKRLVSYWKLLRTNLFLTLAVSVAVGVVVVSAMPLIVSTYGPGFSGAGPVLLLLVFSTIISSTAGVVGQAIASAGQMWSGLLLNLVWAATLICIATYLVPRYGAIGLAGAMFLSYLLHGLISALYVRFFFINTIRRSCAITEPALCRVEASA